MGCLGAYCGACSLVAGLITLLDSTVTTAPACAASERRRGGAPTGGAVEGGRGEWEVRGCVRVCTLLVSGLCFWGSSGVGRRVGESLKRECHYICKKKGFFSFRRWCRGTSLIRKRPPPQDHPRTLNLGLRLGSGEVRFLISEVPQREKMRCGGSNRSSPSQTCTHSVPSVGQMERTNTWERASCLILFDRHPDSVRGRGSSNPIAAV